MREALSFGAAFFLASFVSIVMFDGTRGAHWWTAPLFGFLSSRDLLRRDFLSGSLCRRRNRPGSITPWSMPAVLAGEGILLLIPYWMLRHAVQPLSGFGGY